MNHQSTLSEGKSELDKAMPQKQTLGVYDWNRYFESANTVLKVEKHIKGDTVIEYRLDTTETMIDLAQKMVEELLRMGLKSLEKPK